MNFLHTLLFCVLVCGFHPSVSDLLKTYHDAKDCDSNSKSLHVVDCNTCKCRDGNLVDCTKFRCNAKPDDTSYLECVEGEVKWDACSFCKCQNETWVCLKLPCGSPEDPEQSLKSKRDADDEEFSKPKNAIVVVLKFLNHPCTNGKTRREGCIEMVCEKGNWTFNQNACAMSHDEDEDTTQSPRTKRSAKIVLNFLKNPCVDGKIRQEGCIKWICKESKWESDQGSCLTEAGIRDNEEFPYFVEEEPSKSKRSIQEILKFVRNPCIHGKIRNEGCIQCVCKLGKWECNENNCAISDDHVEESPKTKRDAGDDSSKTRRAIPLFLEFVRNPCSEGKTRREGCIECQCQNGEWQCDQSTCAIDEDSPKTKRAAEIDSDLPCLDGSVKQDNCNECVCKSGTWECTQENCNNKKRTTRNIEFFEEDLRDLPCAPRDILALECSFCICNDNSRGYSCHKVSDCNMNESLNLKIKSAKYYLSRYNN